jgi:predicted GNAT family N-acyltransferase
VDRDFHVELVSHDWHRFEEVLDLSYGVLYSSFGVPRGGDWYQPADGSRFAVAIGTDGELLGTARLLPAPDAVAHQVRQVAVSPDARRRGIGHALMGELERVAAEKGAIELWLHARENAFDFYDRLGYRAEGEIFVSELTGIPHRTMRKRLERTRL